MKKTLLSLLLVIGLNQFLKSQTWSALGTGVNFQVSNMKVDQVTGDVYVSSASGGVINVFKFNGSVWAPMGSGFDSYIYSIEIFNNEVYACGAFATADGNAVKGIAKWSGTTWVSVGGGLTSPGTASGSCMKAFNNKLYIGGGFTQVGGSVSARGIASWDGSNWAPLSTGTSSTGNWHVYSLNVYNNQLIVGGDFISIGGVTTTGIASWNGASFSAFGSGLSGTIVDVEAIDTLNNELYVGGGLTNYNNIAKWNGSSWSQVGNGLNGQVSDLINYNNQILAGGGITTSGTVTINNFAKLNGSTWSSFGVGTNSDVMCFGKFNNVLYAGGNYSTIDNTTISYVAKYSLTTDIKSISNEDNYYSIFPNPTNYKGFKISIKGEQGSRLVVICNMTGSIVYQEITQLEQAILTNLSSGIYYVKVDGVVKKLVID